MGIRVSKLLKVCGLAIWFIAQGVLAQTSARLDIQLFAGLTITGAVGAVYTIEATTDLTRSNGWSCVTFLQLQSSNQVWLDPTTPAMGRRFYRAAVVTPTNMVFIPPGTFRMGSATNEAGRFDDEGPQTEVTLTKSFFMGKYPVTQAEYYAVVGNNPTVFDPSYPVGFATWYDATNYCAKRTEQEAGAGLIPAGSVYRLPTEAEWEYACRAWTSTRFYYGEDLDYTNLINYAWYAANSGEITHVAGQKLPNAWGLHDMVGNVREWCQDQYAPYPGGRVTDPPASSSDSYHVVRGGGWDSDAAGCRSAFRNWSGGSGSFRFHFGFRAVLASGYH